jgi:hypothetical protein
MSSKGHTAYFGCHKCQTEGTYVFNKIGKKGDRVTFPELSAELRDDFLFRNQIHPEHHN